MKFELPSIQVRKRPQKDDSAEVYIGEEFIGVIFRDEEDGELSYNFQMAILDFDLEGLTRHSSGLNGEGGVYLTGRLVCRTDFAAARG